MEVKGGQPALASDHEQGQNSPLLGLADVSVAIAAPTTCLLLRGRHLRALALPVDARVVAQEGDCPTTP